MLGTWSLSCTVTREPSDICITQFIGLSCDVIAEFSGKGRNIRPKESLEYDSLPSANRSLGWPIVGRCRYLAYQGHLIGSLVEIEVDVTEYIRGQLLVVQPLNGPTKVSYFRESDATINIVYVFVGAD